jgi:hypothetical protein
MYRNQVDRLTSEIAGLEKKVAQERSSATRARGDALRVQNSIRSSSSQSTVLSRLRDVQRHEEKAAAHDRSAAQYSDQIATKRRSLTTAQTSLERAEGQVRQKEEREAKRKRETELRHVRELERARRATTRPFPTTSGARPAASEAAVDSRHTDPYEYDVCLSFASENRDYVQMVARGLVDRDVRVFYDEDERTKIKLWGKDLTEHFDRIYREASRYCVMFISEHYARKPWSRHERRSALARALIEEEEYILPARFDDTELAGLPPTVAYLDLTEIAPATLVDHIMMKLGMSS